MSEEPFYIPNLATLISPLNSLLQLLSSSLDQSLTWWRLRKPCIGSDTCVHTVKPHPEQSHLLRRNLHPWLMVKNLMSLCQFNKTKNKNQVECLYLMNIRISRYPSPNCRPPEKLIWLILIFSIPLLFLLMEECSNFYNEYNFLPL